MFTIVEVVVVEVVVEVVEVVVEVVEVVVDVYIYMFVNVNRLELFVCFSLYCGCGPDCFWSRFVKIRKDWFVKAWSGVFLVLYTVVEVVVDVVVVVEVVVVVVVIVLVGLVVVVDVYIDT